MCECTGIWGHIAENIYLNSIITTVLFDSIRVCLTLHCHSFHDFILILLMAWIFTQAAVGMISFQEWWFMKSQWDTGLPLPPSEGDVFCLSTCSDDEWSHIPSSAVTVQREMWDILNWGVSLASDVARRCITVHSTQLILLSWSVM